MRALGDRERTLAMTLAGLAGYVDSIGFMQLGGLFVSFMSGNSTRFAASLSLGDFSTAFGAIGLLALFVVGAMVGGLVAHDEGRRSRARVLAVEAALLGLAAVAGTAGAPVAVAGALMVLAMGVENATFLRNGEVGVGLTYMTGALVKLGHALAQGVRGGDPWGFVPHLALWASLAGGAVLGAFAFRFVGPSALYVAALAAAALALRLRLTPAG